MTGTSGQHYGVYGRLHFIATDSYSYWVWASRNAAKPLKNRCEAWPTHCRCPYATAIEQAPMNRPEDGSLREAHCMARNPFDKRARNRLLGGLAGRYIRFVERSSTLMPGSDDATAVMAAHHPAIIAMWHGEFMLVAPLAPKGFGFANMVARHGDAELIGTALETFDMTLVRGGGAAGRRRDRGGTRAFLEALRLLENGTSITMTADVPPGTPRRAGLGIIKLAQKSGRPIIPLAVASSRFVTVDTWSRMTINLPASRLSLVTGEPVTVDAAADAAELEAARAQLETKLDDATRRAYKLVGADATQATPAAGFKVGDPHPRPGLPLKVYSAAARALAGTVPAVLSYRCLLYTSDAADDASSV